jgi:DNA polymerase (family 10)
MVPWKLAERLTSKQAKAIEGIGEPIAEKISELTQTGYLQFYEELCKELPQDILTLLSIPGLGVREVKVLYERIGVTSITSLEKVCREGKLIALPGFGKKLPESCCNPWRTSIGMPGNFYQCRCYPWLWDWLRN